ncbi:MAG TPA: hypothetical protein VEW25_09300 [Allosphingosinicella sp.]|nr:hypothetical protein [Allosphingosinicella sp.]
MLITIAALLLQPQLPAELPVLRDTPGGVYLDGPSGSCRSVTVSLVLPGGRAEEPDYLGHAVGCPGPEIVNPDEHVVIEGLDRRGRRLWVTRGWDSRFARPPLAPGGGGHGPSVTSADPLVTTVIEVPVTRRIAWLRWYQVEPGHQLRLLGVSRWRPVRERP